MTCTVKLTMVNGDETITRIKGTRDSILAHYRQNNFLTGPEESGSKIRFVEFIGAKGSKIYILEAAE